MDCATTELLPASIIQFAPERTQYLLPSILAKVFSKLIQAATPADALAGVGHTVTPISCVELPDSPPLIGTSQRRVLDPTLRPGRALLHGTPPRMSRSSTSPSALAYCMSPGSGLGGVVVTADEGVAVSFSDVDEHPEATSNVTVAATVAADRFAHENIRTSFGRPDYLTQTIGHAAHILTSKRSRRPEIVRSDDTCSCSDFLGLSE